MVATPEQQILRILQCEEWLVSDERRRRVRKSFGHVKAHPKKRRAAERKESAETQDYVSEPLRMRHLDQNMEAQDEKNTHDLSSECSQRATLGYAQV